MFCMVITKIYLQQQIDKSINCTKIYIFKLERCLLMVTNLQDKIKMIIERVLKHVSPKRNLTKTLNGFCVYVCVCVWFYDSINNSWFNHFINYLILKSNLSLWVFGLFSSEIRLLVEFDLKNFRYCSFFCGPNLETGELVQKIAINVFNWSSLVQPSKLNKCN